jgi:hypothetical protein
LVDEREFKEFRQIQDFVDAGTERIELLFLKRSPWSPRWSQTKTKDMSGTTTKFL